MSKKNREDRVKLDYGPEEPAGLQGPADSLAMEASPEELSECNDWIALGRELFADILGAGEYRRYGEIADRGRRVAGKVWAAVAVVSALVYLFWYLTVANWRAWYMSVPFFFTEAGALIAFALFCFIARNPRYHDPAGQRWDERPPVDIYIATCGEPLDILAPTVEAATSIDYDNKRLHVLDDSGNPAVRQLAESCGCRYLSRAVNTDAKAGNLNHGLQRTTGELILTLDADQVPDARLLKVTVGYFKFPDIAFVQTAQRFKLPEDDPFGNADDLFYQVMQPSKDNDNSAFSCGSGVVYRRSALESIGGFSTWNLVEDLHTSMRLHAAGWRSVYHNHALSTGLAPGDITHVYAQRSQWSIDSLRLMFWDNPLKRRGLNWKQKLQYFSVGFACLQSAAIMPLYFILPSWSLLTGNFPIAAPLGDYLFYRGVYLLFSLMATSYMQHPPSAGKSYRMWAGLFPIHFKAVWRALRCRHSKPAYKVNNKAGDRPLSFSIILKSLSWQLAVVFLTLFAIVLRTLDVNNAGLDLFIMNFAWGLLVLWSLSWICYAALKLSCGPDRDRD